MCQVSFYFSHEIISRGFDTNLSGFPNSLSLQQNKCCMITNTQFSEQLLYSKLSLLNSEPLKQELLFYIESLLKRQFADREQKHKPQFGCAKGSFVLSPDFDEPLDDFKEYMP
jgi:hypothetical protein